MTKTPKKKTQEISMIERSLKAAGYRHVKVYRHNTASIRIRMVDEKFRGKSRIQRESMIAPIIEALPQEIQTDLTMLLLITPGEMKTSLANLEFEHPRRPLL